MEALGGSGAKCDMGFFYSMICTRKTRLVPPERSVKAKIALVTKFHVTVCIRTVRSKSQLFGSRFWHWQMWVEFGTYFEFWRLVLHNWLKTGIIRITNFTFASAENVLNGRIFLWYLWLKHIKWQIFINLIFLSQFHYFIMVLLSSYIYCDFTSCLIDITWFATN